MSTPELIECEANRLMERTIEALPTYHLTAAGIGVEELLRRDGQLPPLRREEEEQ